MPTLVLVTVSALGDDENKLIRSAALLCEVPASACFAAGASSPAQLAVQIVTDHLDRLWALQETVSRLIVKHLVVPNHPPWAQFRGPDWTLPSGVQIWMK
ncbi:MAG TPA: hypothetical protein VGD78_08995 [Chthoniobacterales bacterium]